MVEPTPSEKYSVKLEIFPQNRGEHKTYLQPPPSHSLIFTHRNLLNPLMPTRRPSMWGPGQVDGPSSPDASTRFLAVDLGDFRLAVGATFFFLCFELLIGCMYIGIIIYQTVEFLWYSAYISIFKYIILDVKMPTVDPLGLTIGGHFAENQVPSESNTTRTTDPLAHLLITGRAPCRSYNLLYLLSANLKLYE